MRIRLSGLLIGLALALGLNGLPARAQVSDAQVGALVEALRLAAPKTEKPNDGLYSDWQVKPDNIPRWSKSCLGRELTPEQFAASPVTARGVVTCVVRDMLRDEYKASGGNETIAIRRVAAWWMTGDPNRYSSPDLADYTQKVLTGYQQNKPSRSSAQGRSATSPAASTTTKDQDTPYDRYMRAGYEATRQKDYPTSLLYFRRALDERPEDSYATQAIRNVESYQKPTKPAQTPAQPQSQIQPSPAASPPNSTILPTSGAQVVVPTAPVPEGAPTSTPAPAGSLTQQQAIALINQWLEAKSEIFAPPFNQQRMSDLTTGELYASLMRPDGVIRWLKRNQAYYRYGVQKVETVEQFVSSGDRATIELRVTEDRTLYLNGTVSPRQTDFSARQVRYSLEWVNGNWKIADYKTLDGSLLERTIPNATTTSEMR